MLDPVGSVKADVIGSTSGARIGKENIPMSESTTAFMMVVNGRKIRCVIRDSEWIRVANKINRKMTKQNNTQGSHKID